MMWHTGLCQMKRKTPDWHTVASFSSVPVAGAHNWEKKFLHTRKINWTCMLKRYSANYWVLFLLLDARSPSWKVNALVMHYIAIAYPALLLGREPELRGLRQAGDIPSATALSLSVSVVELRKICTGCLLGGCICPFINLEDYRSEGRIWSQSGSVVWLTN